MADQDLERILADLLAKREALGKLTFTKSEDAPTADPIRGDDPVADPDTVKAER